MDGADLIELPVGEKTTWADWLRRHPETLVLSVDGREHLEHNPYDDYFASDRTFRDLEVDDRRLEPKAPIFGFFRDGKPFAVPHAALAGGRVFELESGLRLLLYRRPQASMFASTLAWTVPADAAGAVDALVAAARRAAAGFEPLGGIDTFWYNWAAVNEGTDLLR